MSSNDQQHQDSGGWEPIPQSEGYDGDATAFVQLPPDFMLDGVPLEAPGHGYVPPMITPLQPLNPGTDPAATGTWTVHVPTQAEQTQYFDGAGAGAGAGAGYAEYAGPEYPEYTERPEVFGGPEAFGRPGQSGQSGYVEHVEHPGYVEQDPHATAEWRFTEPTAPAGPGATGQWQIPALPDTAEAPEATDAFEPGGPGLEPGQESAQESAHAADEFAASAVRPYAGAPATLPGGAPAPWVLAEGERDGEAGADDEPAVTAVEAAPDGTPADGPEDEPAAAGATAVAPGHAPEQAAEQGPGLVPDRAPDLVPGPRSDSAPGHTPEPGVDLAPEPTADPSTGLTPDPDLAPSANVHASTDSDEHPHTSYTLRVNGVDRPVTGSWIGESLLYVLRERLGLAGAKDGCSQGECGACNVQVDGRLVASCLVPAATAAESEVRTVEGLATDGEPSDVQRAMAKCGTVQCGFCIPGMCMTVHDLLEGNHAPTELETRQALAGNLCRCSGYRGVLEAVRDVVAEREASAAATASDGADGPRVPHQIPHPHDGGMA
ncbi:2Fe-2S iron-sulfur cluster-binding protein [Streptomyces exfoliatus]|uniref:2Fe-2S iron-sulfur cluster-binding protein n=1 Tax=Streptomyces exfoliatus TaxID=1905 RepID=A0ABV3CVL4_STREX